MARSIITALKANFGKENKVLRAQYNALVDEMDELKTNYAALLAKLDADGGVTDVDYLSTLANSATEADKIAVK